jgi:hypothetical protein
MRLYQTFEINIADFLQRKTSIPQVYNITVEHFEGVVVGLSISPLVLRDLGDLNGLLDHIDAAAKNNFESFRKTA